MFFCYLVDSHNEYLIFLLMHKTLHRRRHSCITIFSVVAFSCYCFRHFFDFFLYFSDFASCDIKIKAMKKGWKFSFCTHFAFVYSNVVIVTFPKRILSRTPIQSKCKGKKLFQCTKKLEENEIESIANGF